MSSDDPIESAAAGATKGLLEWTSDFIKSLALKFKNKKLAFIQERTTIDVARDQFNSGERKFYNKYVSNNEFLFLIGMGLTLRRLENDEERYTNLKSKIIKKYNFKGLHISYFVQNGILNRYIGILLDTISSIDDLVKKIKDVLEEIDKHTIFVTGQDDNGRVIQKVLTLIAFNPSIFIVSSMGNAAKKVKGMSNQLESLLLSDYELEKISGGNKEILFFKRRLSKQK